MKNLSFRKFLVLTVVLTMLLIANQMIRSVVMDRIHNREAAERSVAEGLAGPQTLAGPMLKVRYTERFTEKVFDEKGNFLRQEERAKILEHLILPEALRLNGHIENQTRYRGVFHVNTFLLSGSLQGKLRLPRLEELPRLRPDSSLSLNGVEALLAVSDPRGLRQLSLKLAGQPLQMEAGSGIKTAASGAHASLPDAAAFLGRTLDFEAELQLAGTRSLSMLPLGRQTVASLSSNWPDPSFDGRFLPVSHKIHDKGFEAEWQVSNIASGARQAWENEEGRTLQAESFSVSLFDPVDIYSMSDRASKYAELFILLTLGAFLLFELLRRLRLHPLNYLMVGAALLLFFLLLLSLSEQIGFGPAYLAASSACVLLIGFYSAHLLRSLWLAGSFTLGLGALYGVIYVILLSEQNALLMGSLLLFALLACVMIGTRKVDWNALLASKGNASPAEAMQD